MEKKIAYCGLDCAKCDARIATIENNDELKEKTAELWSKLNGVTITKEMIRCLGCKEEGVKSPYCESLCPIRKCAREQRVNSCGECVAVGTCEKVGAILVHSPEAKENLI